MPTTSPPFDDARDLLHAPFDGWMSASFANSQLLPAAKRKARMSAIRPGDPDARLTRLMAAAQLGDRDAYAEVLRACVPLIRPIAARRVSADRIDDVVQDVLLTLHRARHTYDPARPFKAWLHAIADRRAIDVLRRTARQNSREVHAPLDYDRHADPSASPERGTEQSETAASVRKAVAALSPNQREAVENLMLNERSLKETAALTGRSEGALKVSLHRALKSLRARFQGGLSDA